MAVKSTRTRQQHHPKAIRVKRTSRYLRSHRGTVPTFLPPLIIRRSRSTPPTGIPCSLQWSAAESLRASLRGPLRLHPPIRNKIWGRGPSRPPSWILIRMQFLRKADFRSVWISIAPAASPLALRWPVRVSLGMRSVHRSAIFKVRCIQPQFRSSGSTQPPCGPDDDSNPSIGRPISHSADLMGFLQLKYIFCSLVSFTHSLITLSSRKTTGERGRMRSFSHPCTPFIRLRLRSISHLAHIERNALAPQVETDAQTHARTGRVQDFHYSLQSDGLEALWTEIQRRVNLSGHANFLDCQIILTAKNLKLQTQQPTWSATQELFFTRWNRAVNPNYLRHDFFDIAKEVVPRHNAIQQSETTEPSLVLSWRRCCLHKFSQWLAWNEISSEQSGEDPNADLPGLPQSIQTRPRAPARAVLQVPPGRSPGHLRRQVPRHRRPLRLRSK